MASFGDAVSAVTAEVNDFLATISNFSQVRSIDTTLGQMHKYGNHNIYLVTVTFLVS